MGCRLARPYLAADMADLTVDAAEPGRFIAMRLQSIMNRGR